MTLPHFHHAILIVQTTLAMETPVDCLLLLTTDAVGVCLKTAVRSLCGRSSEAGGDVVAVSHLVHDGHKKIEGVNGGAMHLQQSPAVSKRSTSSPRDTSLFDTDLKTNNQRTLRQPLSVPTTHHPPITSHDDVVTLTLNTKPTIRSIKGLQNRGSTCYANSVFQCLASLPPFCVHLGRINQMQQHNNSSNLASELFEILQYVNGHEPSSTLNNTAKMKKTILNNLLSSSSPGNTRSVMNTVARHHTQFQSRSGAEVSGSMEQQDAHEFFSALMDVLSLDEKSQIEGGYFGTKTAPTCLHNNGLASSYNLLVYKEGGGTTKGNDDNNISNGYQEEKKYEDNTFEESAETVLCQDAHCKNQGPQKQQVLYETSQTKIPMTQNPFDGWVGSTIKCSICQRIRPIRSTPFLCLSLPIANNPPSHVRLEDFILSELGGFATAERVSDVECVSCALVKKVQELEEELLLLTGAISSIQKRNKGVGVKANEAASIQSLVLESQQLQYTISNLRASDPDADDEDREDHGDRDVAIGFELLQATIKSCPRLTPIRGNALKATLMMRPPKVLCIHVQRRHFDVRCQRMAKLNRRVTFLEVLDASEFYAYAENSFEQRSDTTPYTTSTGTHKILYKLMSVIEHLGGSCGGHYQSYRRSDWEDSSKQWVLVSDERVTSCTWNDVQKCQPYMLYYTEMH